MAWKPDIRTLDNTQSRHLFPPPDENVNRIDLLHGLNRLASMVVVEISCKYAERQDSPAPSGNVGNFFSWIKRHAADDETEFMQEARSLSSLRRPQVIEELCSEFQAIPEARAVECLHSNIDDILHERRTGVDVLVAEGVLSALYEEGLFMTSAYPQLFNLFDSLSHANPSSRILELGAGTGGATRIALKALCGSNSSKRYKDYTFTDILPGFLAPAQETMAGFRDMMFSVLDIEDDPSTQGFDPVYDVVMASQTLHATAIGFVLGTLTGYWNGIPYGRFESPFLSQESWDLTLKDAAFSGTEVLLGDYPAPFNTTTTLLSTTAEEEHPIENGLANGVIINGIQEKTSVELVYEGGGSIPPLLEAVREALERLELSPNITTWDNVTEVQQGAHILAFLSGKSLLVDAEEAHLKAFQQLARRAATLVCLTSCGMAKGRNPEGAIVPGLLRTVGTENPASTYIPIDVDAENIDINHKELEQWLIGKQDGCIWVSRVVNDSGLQAYSEVIKTPKTCGIVKGALGDEQPFRADFETPGILSSLYFKPYAELWQPLPPGWIDIRTVAVGLNWKDVGLASGRFDGSNLSSEYMGIVTAIGSGVTKFSVGDPVYGTGKGHFGNFSRVKAVTTHILKPGDNLVEVATMPLVYMTAVHAFDNLAHLQRGQTVLIQSATGGLGLAAIRLAQAKGADVFATVGTTEKAQFLVNKMGIAASHILSSRNPADLLGAVKLTAKGGFDVVLNSSSGDMLYASIQSLTPRGHLVDVGRMDVMGAKAIGLELFQKGASFSSFDLSLVLDNDPRTRWRATLLEFSKGTHIGQLVVTYTDPNSEVGMISAPPAARFDVDACYIVTGGLGRLGRSIIRWMGGRGARHLVVLSGRGPDSPGAREFVQAMKAGGGIDVQVVACDISQRQQVDRVVRDATADRPLKGIVHSAVSYLDISFDKVSIDRWHQSLAAKVGGTRNLHEATLDMPLDFFVMTTSIESICALATQSAYTAANNFQEYFARYRRRLGLPATAISFGFIDDLGSLSTDSITVDLFARNKVLTISEHQFLALLEPAFLNQGLPEDQEGSGSHSDPLSAASIITCVDPAAMAAKKLDDEKAGIYSSASVPRWYSDGRVSHMMRAFQDAQRHSLDAGANQGDEATAAESAMATLRREFAQAVQEGTAGLPGTIDLVKRAITSAVAEMLFIDPLGVHAAKTVAEHGVDSLIAAEPRNWFLKALGVNISMLELLDARTSIEQLSTNIATGAVSGNSHPKAAA
ncbi:KR domain-containing protein [Poronia punctata]|nr:KR domain-containing protein [Poronia punctata]